MGNQLAACGGRSKTLDEKDNEHSLKVKKKTAKLKLSELTENAAEIQPAGVTDGGLNEHQGGGGKVVLKDRTSVAEVAAEIPPENVGQELSEQSGERSSEATNTGEATSTGEEVASNQGDDFQKKANALRKVIQRRLMKVDLTDCPPEGAVDMLIDNMNIKLLISLKKKLLQSSDEWFHRFIDAQGITRLLDAIDLLTSSRVSNVTDAMLLLAAIECIRSVMNNTQGLEFFISDIDSTHQLVKAMDTPNCVVKRQVVQLLTAVCIYSEEGYHCTLQALHFYKVSKKGRYRFSLIVNELKKSSFSKYSIALVNLITCLIDGHDDMPQEHDALILNEFLGLNLLDVVQDLLDSDDHELVSQTNQLLALIDDMQESSQGSTHADKFSDIYKQVCGLPQADYFLTALHFMSDISTDTLSNEKWEALSDFILKLSMCEKLDGIKRLQSIPNSTIEVSEVKDIVSELADSSCEQPTAIVEPTKPIESKELPVMVDEAIQTDELSSINAEQNGTDTLFQTVTPSLVDKGEPVPLPPPSDMLQPPPPPGGIPPPPPPPGGIPPPPPGGIPPPPPPPRGIPPPPPPPGGIPPPGGVPPPSPPPGGIPPPPPPPGDIPPPPPPPGGIPPPPPPPGGIPPPPPPPGGVPPPPPPPGGIPPPPGMGPPPPPPPGGFIVPSTAAGYNSAATSSIAVVPTPTPSKKMKIYNWTKIQDRKLRTSSGNIWEKVSTLPDLVYPDFHAVEEMFSQKTITNVDQPDAAPTKKKCERIALLDSKRSMNVNIFLKQFKMGNSEIVELIKSGAAQQIGPEKLIGLLKIMPQSDEVESIKRFEGDESKLGNAEQFYKVLIQLPDYQLRIEVMIMKLEFTVTSTEMKTTLSDYKSAIDLTINSISLEQFLRLVLVIGNFINKGRYAGNAAGFRLSSLSKLTDTKSNRARVTLLHYIIEEIHKQDSEMLKFVEKLHPVLKSVSRKSLDNLESELNTTKGSVSRISKNIKNSKDDSVRAQFEGFIQEVTEEMNSLYDLLDVVKKQSGKLAEFLCEDQKTFSIDEFLLELLGFLEKCEQAHTDNIKRKELEERNARRKKEREEAALKKKSSKRQSKRESEGEVDLVEMLLGEIKNGKTLRRVRRSERTA